jgi:tRNA (guanine37-N1)-methyltransferase
MRLKEQLKELVPSSRWTSLSNHFEVIGDIAIITIPPELEDDKHLIAETIRDQRRNIKTVLNKTTKREGEGRCARYEVLAGNSTVTVYREFGCRYRMDLSEVFFTSRLAYERHRVTSMVEPGERVLIPFCGVGPYAIPAAVRGAWTVAVEKSPPACRWLAENARRNGVSDRIAIIKGDAFTIPDMLRCRFDRAIIPTPYGRDDILSILSPCVVPGGTVHFTTFKKAHQIAGLVDAFRNMGLAPDLYRRCGNVAPGVSRWVFDLRKT